MDICTYIHIRLYIQIYMWSKCYSLPLCLTSGITCCVQRTHSPHVCIYAPTHAQAFRYRRFELDDDLFLVVRCELDASLETKDGSQVLIWMSHVAHTPIHKSCLPYDWILWYGANLRLSRLRMARRYWYVMAPLWLKDSCCSYKRVKVSCINTACHASLLIDNGSQISVRWCTHIHKLRRTQERVILYRTSYRVAMNHRMPYLYRLFSAKERWNSWLFCGKRPAS